LAIPGSENSIGLPKANKRVLTRGKNIQEKTANLPKGHECYQ